MTVPCEPSDLKPAAIDRLSPTSRPQGRAAMRHRWAHLLFLHWPVPVESLAPLLPPGLEVDTFEGQAYVGLVPFTMTGVRPVWSPAIRPLSDFHETNVRTYVHRQGRDPGVWFFSLDAANAVAVRAARTFWKLPYHFARMELHQDGDIIRYSTERLWPGPTPACCSVEYRPASSVSPATPGTLEHFLIERYILYAYARGRLYKGRVHHPAYPVQAAEVRSLQENMLEAGGIVRPDAPPQAHYAFGVSVEVFSLHPVE
jgi:uncharacterized protein